MSWRDRMGRWFGGAKAGGERGSASTSAQWLPRDRTPFGVPVLDLISITGDITSASENVKAAETSVSWDTKTVADLVGDLGPARTVECKLTYPSERDLPDGWLFVPSRMEEKWVIGLRAGRILVARSWTGEVKASANVRHEGDVLSVRSADLADDSLGVFGNEIETLDWLIRSHALAQVVPLPCSEDGAKLLEAVPLAVFSHHGNVARYAATSWSPSAPARPLRATSALVTAVRLEQPERIAELAAAGMSLDARAPVGGYTALHVAAIKGSLELAQQLLELGANPNVVADRDASVFITAVVHKGSLELLHLLDAHGADVTIANVDGFGALHASAEVDYGGPVPWLVSKGLNLEARTHNGHTPLQIAAALGHVSALNALLDAGADPSAKSAQGTARDIALAQGKTASVAALDARR